MAQDKTLKRQHLARSVIDNSVRLWDAFRELQEDEAERVQVGDWADADFTTPELSHLTPFLVESFLDNVIADLGAWFGDPAHPERKAYILQIRG